jgi:PAB-dependent poly(A)-specific ribonuclease subunit 2
MITGPPLLNRRQDLIIHSVPMTVDEFPRVPGFLCAIDAEFVAMSKADMEIRSNGVIMLLIIDQKSFVTVQILVGTC